jgi:hypothetical protein
VNAFAKGTTGLTNSIQNLTSQIVYALQTRDDRILFLYEILSFYHFWIDKKLSCSVILPPTLPAAYVSIYTHYFVDLPLLDFARSG